VLENSATGKKVSSHSDFHMASAGKPFVATAILRLSEQGKLNPDSTLCHYLPYFVMKDPGYRKITLRHILTHSSGIPDVGDYEWDRPQFDDQSAERYARTFIDSTLDFAPGTQFKYSNAAFDILAAVIYRVTGKPFETYVRQQILLPIGMRTSSFLFSDIAMENRAAPHGFDEQSRMTPIKVYPYNRIHAPSSTLHSNLDDMLQWVRLYLGKGTYRGTTIIRQKTWELMLTPQRTLAQDYNVCLSWFQTVIEGKKIYFHSGGDIGFGSFAGICPSANIAVVLMGNNQNFDGAEVGFQYFRVMLSNGAVSVVQK
jgi:CubicO group peptidase (beta-lactamase class C family)